MLGCPSVSTGLFDGAPAFSSWAARLGVRAAIGLHAFHSGRLLVDCGLPYALVFGGTDVAPGEHESGENRRVMDLAVAGARYAAVDA